MSASIPTPFNFGRTQSNADSLFDSLDDSDLGTLDTAGNDQAGATKTGGGLPSNEDGVILNVESGKAGFRYYFDVNNENPLIPIPIPFNFTETGEKRILMFGMQANATNRRQLQTFANEGKSLKMYSGADTTNEIREWILGGSDTKLANRIGIFLFAIDPEADGSVSDIGEFDASDVLRYGHFISQSNMAGSGSAYWFWCAAVLISSEKDSTDIPRIFGTNSSWQDLVDEVQGTTDFTGQNHLYVEKSGNRIDLSCPCSIGNASQTSPTQTTFNDSGLNINSPSSAEASDPRFHLTSDSMRFYLDLRNDAADTAVFSGTYLWGTQAAFDFSQSNSASVTLSGATFTGMGEFTCGSSVSGNATFNLGGTNKVIINGANLNGSTINGDADVKGGTVTTLTNIDVTGVLNFDTAGTYTNDGGIVNEVTNSSSGNITLALINGATVTTNTGPNITLSQPVDITAPNIINSSRVKITNITKSLTLDNSVVSGGSGYSFTVNLQNANVDIGDTIRLQAAYQNGNTAKKQLTVFGVLTSTGLSFIDSQEDLLAYASLGVDGSTVSEYTLDANTGVLEINANDADCESTKKRLVARYYYLITTQDGIDRFFNGIILEDEANAVIDRSITSLMVDNTGNCTLNLTDNGFRLYTSDGSSWIQDPPSGRYGIISDSGKVYAVNQYQIETIVNAIKAKTDLFSFNTNNDVKATLDGEQVVASNITTPPTVTEIRAGFDENDFKADVTNLDTTISSRSTFDPASDTVARVTLVDTTTSNTDMRGTNNANTVAPDNAGIAQIQTDISNLNDITAAEVYTEFTSGNNEDAFKAVVSNLATQVSIDNLNNLSTSDIDARLTNYGLPTLTEMTAAFTEIKGTGWTVSNTLKAIKDELNNVGTSPADIWSYSTRTLTSPSLTQTDIANAVWDESYSNHTTSGTFGKLMDLLRKANRAIDGEVTGTPTVSSFETNLTGYATGSFNSEIMVFVSGVINGEAKPILSYNSTNGTFNFEEQWTQAPNANDEFVILPYHVHAISEIQNGLAAQTDVTTAKNEIIADNRLFQESDEYKTPTGITLTEKGNISNVLVEKTYTSNGAGTESLTETS